MALVTSSPVGELPPLGWNGEIRSPGWVTSGSPERTVNETGAVLAVPAALEATKRYWPVLVQPSEEMVRVRVVEPLRVPTSVRFAQVPPPSELYCQWLVMGAVPLSLTV